MTIPQTICEQFGLYNIQYCEPLGNGLINSSYKVQANNGRLYFLQKINTAIFKKPLALQTNYEQVETYLSAKQIMSLPKLIKTVRNELLYEHNNEVWRCFAFVPDTFSPLTVDTPEQAYEVAHCFGRFTGSLHQFDSRRLETVIPDFHNLSFRYREYETALQSASASLLHKAKYLVEKAEDYKYLVKLYEQIALNKRAFPLHVMHHDCKVSNILFDKKTGTVRCPIDLDTTQPGLFFSDVGDMIRTMAPDKSENDTDIDNLVVRPAFLKAIMQGYTDAMSGCFTLEEKENLHRAGMIMTYMQAIRFLTDYLNGNVYYKTEYPEQNRDRTANQLRLLQLLNAYAESTAVR